MKGILCDIGGVLYEGDKLISGAVEAIDYLKGKYKIRFLSNSSRNTPENIYKKLKNFGFNIEENEIFTALLAIKKYLIDNNKKAYIIATDEAKEYLKNIKGEGAVVVADAYTNFSYEALNTAFRKIIKGAEFLATNKNRYFKENDELSLDAGAFVAALEYSTEKKAEIFGKPSCKFFTEAINDMNLNKKEVIMIGDDMESDIIGAKKCGIKTVLVKIGKFKESDLKKANPDFVVDSIAKIMKIL
ncbi:phospholysine phosphohistidine inorganic pyrophosphate phosphatase [Lebetimonas natsushimae]|uniref:Haloacid dehalogenase-like hydrolase domain-containing protein 2 n=1 Tax=Lebetimonas natsushimae TaxID=1936991 RepID=A0A292YB54_9BACT|nr:TIGR01458 family HAD-type hydrolase [Lebetimonas natsushimae]GAX86759.1 phospholysine phosphohistidine inorganic pyrophosphate phosphatase [Lebetimonas natsushimae]